MCVLLVLWSYTRGGRFEPFYCIEFFEFKENIYGKLNWNVFCVMNNHVELTSWRHNYLFFICRGTWTKVKGYIVQIDLTRQV